MTKKREDPFATISTLQEQLQRFFADDFPIDDLASAWVPPVDIYESSDRYVLQAEVPGLESNDIKIEVHQNRVQVCGHRKVLLSGAQKYHLAEIPHGEFRRSFEFPVAIEADQVKAELSDGILIINLPKQSADGARKVRIG
ncbi:MAG TPA: Hsp20/alpha crystallin family protein [Acidobacteriota bacterium]